jgi:hypothetical protein
MALLNPRHLFALAVLVGTCGSAFAQEIPSTEHITPQGVAPTAGSTGIEPVNTGPEPDTGILLGGWMLFPKLNVGGIYNDNVFAVPNNTKQDFIFEAEPSVDLETTWTHYLIALRAEDDLQQYAKYTSENLNDYLFSGEFKFDLGADTQVDANSEYARLTEVRGDTNLTSGAAKPTNYDRWYNSLNIEQAFSQFIVQLNGSYTTLRFFNVPAIGGGTIIEDDRDRNVSTAALDLGYNFDSNTQMFARATWDERDYTLASFDFRNSHGYQADVGMRLNLTSLIVGQAYVGYLQEDYQPPLVHDIGGLDYGAQLDWYPTDLTTVDLAGYRSIEETDQVGATAYLANTAALNVTHSLTQAITLNAGISYANNDYKGVTRVENIYAAVVGVDYGLTAHLHLTGDYTYTHRASDVAGADYGQNVVEIHARLAI